MDFNQTKNDYTKARKNERRKIREKLKDSGFIVRTCGRAGQGLPDYTSDNRLEPPVDLSNWLYVEGVRESDNLRVFVSLQAFDRDPNSNNIHVLMDRVGVRVSKDYSDPSFFPTKDVCIESWVIAWEEATTPLNLPLDTEDLSSLLELIEEKANNIS